MVSNEERRAIDDLIERLTKTHPGLGRDQIATIVGKAHDEFSAAKVRDFVPLFVERRVHVLLGEHDDVTPASFG